MNLKKFLFKFYSFQFFFSLLVWIPVFYEYQKRIGLNDTEIFKIQSIYYLVFCLLEIPTGYLADWLGYKLCLILGSVTLILANVLVPIAPSYTGFLSHFLLIALARSFVSGASSAYLYETLHHHNLLDEYKDAEGKARAYSLVGKVACFAVVGFLMEWHLTLPYWITAFNAFIGLIFAAILPETKLAKTNERTSVTKIFSILYQNPYLILIMLQGVALFVLSRICQVNLFQPILKNKGFSLVNFGMVMSLMTIFEAIGSFKSKWVRKYVNDLNAVFIFTFIIGISFYLMSFNDLFGIDKKIMTLFALSLFSYIIGISFPIQRQLMNKAIPEPKLRASLLSCESIIDRATNSVVATFLGAALASNQLLLFLKQSAFIAVISVFIIAMLIRFLRNKNYEATLS